MPSGRTESFSQRKFRELMYMLAIKSKMVQTKIIKDKVWRARYILGKDLHSKTNSPVMNALSEMVPDTSLRKNDAHTVYGDTRVYITKIHS